MNKYLLIALFTLISLSCYAQTPMDEICADDDQDCHFKQHHRQQKFVVCKKDQGAQENSEMRIRSCANLLLDEGCYCGPKHQVYAVLSRTHERRVNREAK